MNDQYTNAPDRIRIARIIFAFLALVFLVVFGLIITLHPSVTTENDQLPSMVIGALISLNMITFRFLFDTDEGSKT